MNHIVRNYGLKPGDRVVVPKSEVGFVQHHAIYLGQDQKGIDFLIENNVSGGVRLISADAFFNSAIGITRVERFEGKGFARKQVVMTALAKAGKPYHLINYNCEHFVNDVLKGKPASEQVAIGFGILAATIFVALLAAE